MSTLPVSSHKVTSVTSNHKAAKSEENITHHVFEATHSSIQDSSIAPTLVNRVSSPQSSSSAEPTLEEKKELCELLKKAIKDPLDPRPLDIPAMAREFESSGYDNKVLAKLQKDIFHLCFGACGLKALPSSIRLLKGLRELDLSCNQLETLPNELIEIPELYTLHLQDNQFNKVPPVVLEVAKKHGFSRLDLTHNPKLKEIPISLKKGVRIISLPEWYTPI
jgi:hypothetical protein